LPKQGFKRPDCVVLHCQRSPALNIPRRLVAAALLPVNASSPRAFAADDFSRTHLGHHASTVEGEPRALTLAGEMATDLGATCLTI